MSIERLNNNLYLSTALFNPALQNLSDKERIATAADEKMKDLTQHVFNTGGDALMWSTYDKCVIDLMKKNGNDQLIQLDVKSILNTHYGEIIKQIKLAKQDLKIQS